MFTIMQSMEKNCEGKVKQKKKGGRGEEEPLKKDAKIGIVGGGIGGLATALALKRAGFMSIVVYERDESLDQFRRDGYGLTLTYNPKGPLAKLGILEQVCLQDTPSRSHYLFQAPKGDILGYYGRTFSAYSDGIHQRIGVRTGQRGNLRIPRQKLREILLHELLITKHNATEGTNDNACIEVRWGKRLIDFAYSSSMVADTSPCNTDDKKSQEHLNEEKKTNEGSTAQDGFVTLSFADGTRDHVELLIAADGVYSTVQAKVEEDQHLHVKNHDKYCSINAPPPSTLQYIGIMLINGITLGFHHPLLDERGFYTVDGENRLFTMPFEGSYVDDHLGNFLSTEGEQHREFSATPNAKRRTMWQLSFRLPDVTMASQLRQGGPKRLLEEALRRCSSWHPPVCDMLRSTPLDCIWGSGLMDRMPNVKKANTKTGKTQIRRIVVLGDAMHAMSPFKGQGANQALSDGPLLVDWLCRKGASLTVALSHFEREMIHRTRNKVIASREAAIYLHSPQVLQTQHDFSGVPKEVVTKFLHELQMRNITAHLGGQLDKAIYRILHEMSIVKPNISVRVDDEKETSAGSVDVEMLLKFAQEGNLSELRKISLQHHHSYLIGSSRMDDTGETCLHLAAKNGHYDVCRWLLSEGYFSSVEDDLDCIGHCPLIAAIAGVADPQVIAMILAISSKSTNTEYDNELDQRLALKRQKLLNIVQNIMDHNKRSIVMQLLNKSKYRDTSR